MGDPAGRYVLIGFPILFAASWTLISVFLGLFAGWFALSSQYPDQTEMPLLKLTWVSGCMGAGVSIRSALKLSVCPTGLRVGINRLLGPFWRTFFVPWQEIRIQRRPGFLDHQAELEFGRPLIGRLTIPAHVADRLARASGGRWPEPGPFPRESRLQSAFGVARTWALQTGVAGAFFIGAPLLMTHSATFPSVFVAVLFPAIFFGVGALIEYSRRRHEQTIASPYAQ